MSYAYNLSGSVTVEIYDTEDNFVNEIVIDAEDFLEEDGIPGTEIYKAHQREFALQFTLNNGEGRPTTSEVTYEVFDEQCNLNISSNTLDVDIVFTDEEY